MRNVRYLILVLVISCFVLGTNQLLGFEIIPKPTEISIGENLVSIKETEEIRLTPEQISDEAYEMVLDNEGKLKISASSESGFFYAKQTLRQISSQAKEGKLPEFRIRDIPKVNYRVFMLDSGRQYHSVEVLKKTLDLLSELKINTFHWHLTDGMGWRMPIESFPQLTTFGAFVAKGPEQQGFYSPAEIKELNAYAAKRFIQIVPEIDLPGHSEAALSAYPEWSCRQKKPEIREGFSEVIFCAGKEKSLEAMKRILTETAQLFPGKYLHIGGDEAPKGEWKKCEHCQAKMKKLGVQNEHELHIVLINELSEHVLKLGKTPIIWNDPIKAKNQTKLRPEVIVQYWNMRGDKGLEDLDFLTKSRQKIIFTPNKFSYLNFPQEPWRGYKKDRVLSNEKCYEQLHFPIGNKLPFGIGCALWTDYNLTQNALNSRLFPRIYFQAELMWGGKMPSEKFEYYQEKRRNLESIFTHLP